MFLNKTLSKDNLISQVGFDSPLGYKEFSPQPSPEREGEGKNNKNGSEPIRWMMYDG